MAATKMFFRSGFDMQTSWTTYLLVVWKSSRLLGSLLTKSSGLPGSRLDFRKVVWTSRKSSGLPGSRLDFRDVVWTSGKSSELHGSLLTKSPFHNRSERFSFSDLEDFWDDLPVSRLEVVWKSSELPKSLLTKSSELLGSRLDFLEVF
uniref:Uncharacterized protein n=1 Tax=Brassica oleracea var. oleracea TaxID=109376 RepID=A0A0D3D958_BRAOL